MPLLLAKASALSQSYREKQLPSHQKIVKPGHPVYCFRKSKLTEIIHKKETAESYNNTFHCIPQFPASCNSRQDQVFPVSMNQPAMRKYYMYYVPINIARSIIAIQTNSIATIPLLIIHIPNIPIFLYSYKFPVFYFNLF